MRSEGKYAMLFIVSEQGLRPISLQRKPLAKLPAYGISEPRIDLLQESIPAQPGSLFPFHNYASMAEERAMERASNRRAIVEALAEGE